MKLLLIAEACNPEWTSVPLVGFNMVDAIVQRNPGPTTVVSHVRNRTALLNAGLDERAELVFIDNEWLAKPMYQLGKCLRGGSGLGWTTNMAVNWPAYVAFELSIARVLSERLSAGGFDLIHRVTPVSPTLPSPLATRTDTPMIVGPLNGGLPWPNEYPSLASNEREWLTPLRSLHRRLPFYRKSYQALAGVIGGSRHTLASLDGVVRGQRWYLPENGIDPQRFPVAEGWTPPSGRFEYISVGRLVPYKGFDLTLEAMAASPRLRKCRLTIIGDGPERKALLSKATQLGLSDVIEWTGWLPQGDLARRLSQAQAFVFPSLREFGGGVVLEAMASGLPSIVVDYGGPSELVEDAVGIRVPLQARDALIANLSAAMERVAVYRDTAASMARAATDRVRSDFTWQRKADRVAAIYGEVLGHTPDDSESTTSTFRSDDQIDFGRPRSAPAWVPANAAQGIAP